MDSLRHLAPSQFIRVFLPGARVEAFVSVRVGIALQHFTLAVDEALVDGHSVVAHCGEDHGPVGAEVMVHTHTEQGLKKV